MRIGENEPEWGFTSLKVLPDCDDMIALKVREVGGETATKITVFNLKGDILMNPTWFPVANLKYEGIEFV